MGLAIVVSLWLAAPLSAGEPVGALTIDELGSVSSYGLAAVSGTASCPGAEAVAEVRVRQETAAGILIEGWASIVVECGKPWVASGILSNKVDDHGNGLFEPGPADVWIGGYLCEGGSCPFTSVQRTVTLQGQFAPNAGWTYVGSGPLATSTGLTASVRYPSGVEAGDLLFMSCQGRRNTMRWSAPGFSWILDYDDWPGGPPGLRHAILYRWADGSEASHVSARNSTGVNGWSCVISAFRGETGPGPVWAPGGGTIGGPTQIMTNHIGNVRGYLVLDWFVSADDNNHGSPSHGTLAFGGPAYDTTIGTDHAVSMAYYVGNASLGPHTMRQLARGGDPYTSHAIPLRPVQ